MKKNYEFDWTKIPPEDVIKTNDSKNPNTRIGSIPIRFGYNQYIADLYHQYFNKDNHGYTICVYESNKKGEHKDWMFDVPIMTQVASERGYKILCNRCERNIIRRLRNIFWN